MSQGYGPGQRVAVWLPRGIEPHVVILGILKAGAAYVPLDAEYPPDRVAFIVENSGAVLLVTTRSLAEGSIDSAIRTAFYEDAPYGQRSASETPTTPVRRQPTPDDEAYVIYTSGTTGRPKGVSIPHRAIAHLVLTERAQFGVTAADRVFQGFSLAFDASLEEIWLAFSTGATLVVATAETVRMGIDLSDWLTRHRITVFSTVPTQLLMLDRDIPSVRLLIVGGEACPLSLIDRWATAGRTMWNTYGPTEATVIATWTRVQPGKPVTIGVPLPGYTAVIVDEQRRPVSGNTEGELCLGGVALANGYVGLPEQTAEKFCQIKRGGGDAERMYRTGDLCRWNAAGEIEYLGRIDTQVKLRGYRIELGEIEAVLVTHPSVETAAVVLRHDAAERPFLAAFLSARPGRTIDLHALQQYLRERLASYMVPAVFQVVDRLPRLSSGKLDRKSLPEVTLSTREASPAHTGDPEAPPSDPLERELLAEWQRLFATDAIRLDEHFFNDLGGDSLLAAGLVSQLRARPQFIQVSMRDLYQFPTVRELAAHLREAASRAAQSAQRSTTGTPPQTSQEPPRLRHSSWRFTRCGIAQFCLLYFILGVGGVQWLAPYATYSYLAADEHSRTEAALGGIVVMVGIYPLLLLMAIIVKWVVLGRVKAGRYPLWGWFYLRWWFVRAIESFAPAHYLTGTPLLNWYCRCMGARIGQRVYLGTDSIGPYDLLEIGDDTSVSADSSLIPYHVINGYLILGPTKIGKGCFLGARSLVCDHVVIEDGARIESLSHVASGTVIPARETWGGAPAVALPREAVRPAPVPPPVDVSTWHRIVFGAMQLFSVMVVPVLVVGAILPGMALMHELNEHDDWYTYLLLSPIVGLIFVMELAFEIAILKRLLLGTVQPGTYRQHSWFALRKWWIDKLMELSLDVVGPLYATLYLAPWYRALGAKVGARAEISTASLITPDLLTLGDESFVADLVSLGAPHVEGGWIRIDPVSIGRRTFIGNSALLPGGTTVGDDCLIGCLSVPPRASPTVPAGTSWIGSPAMFLHQRHVEEQPTDEETYAPTRSRVAQRLAIELLRISLPSAAFVCIASLMFSLISILRDEIELWQLVLLLPVLYGVVCSVFVMLAMALKWLVIGRYRPRSAPLWNHFVFRTEFITALHDYFSAPCLLDPLAGTPFLAVYFRMMGAKIGQRVFFDSPEISEFDLVQVDDDASINSGATLQTHLFEDRVMKMSHVHIGADCAVGCESLVLYDTEMQPGSTLAELSLLMKGETLPPNTHWTGTPARPLESGHRPGEQVTHTRKYEE